MQFPSEQRLEEFKNAGVFTQAGDFLASALLNASQKDQEGFVKEFAGRSVASTLLQTHEVLRKAVFRLVFKDLNCQNVDIDTFFNLVALFGSKNVVAAINVLENCKRSILMKIGNFLLTKAEIGFNLEYTDLQQTLLVLFSAKNISETVLTDQFFTNLRNLKPKTWESELLIKIGDVYKPEGPVYQLKQVFPDLVPTTCHALLVVSEFNVEELTMKLLDTSVEEILSASKPINDVYNESKPIDPKKKQEIKMKYWLGDDENDNENDNENDDAVNDRREDVNNELEDLNEDDYEEDHDDLGIESIKSVADKNLDKLQEHLWAVYNADRTVFDRSQRKSNKRTELKKQLNGWTDEQIEGWARIVGSQQTGSTANYFTRTKHVKLNNKPAKQTNSSNASNPSNSASKSSAKPVQPQPKKPTPNKAAEKRERERNQRRRENKINNNRKKKEKKLAPKQE